MDLWKTAGRLRLLNVPLYAITLAVVTGVWLWASQPIPAPLLVPVAVVLNPATWFALALYRRISAYERSVARIPQASEPPPGDIEREAYRRFKRMYALRERLAQRKLTCDGVYLAHFLKHLYLDYRISRDPMNPHENVDEETAALHPKAQRRRLNFVSQFVFNAALRPHGEPQGNSDQDKALAGFVGTIPPDAVRMTQIVEATFGDGEGFNSTLTALTHIHYVFGLAPMSREQIVSALTDLEFDVELYGWLGHRVLEALVQLHLRDGADRKTLGSLLQPVLDDATIVLEHAGDPDAVLRAKWRARSEIRTRLGID
jgi:hypothetical protein